MGGAKAHGGAMGLATLAMAAGLLGACYGGQLVSTMTPQQRARMEQEQAQQEAERLGQEQRSPHYHGDFGQWQVRCDRDPVSGERPCFLRAPLERHPVLGPARGYVYVTPEADLVSVHVAYVTAIALRVDDQPALQAGACTGPSEMRRYCLFAGDAGRRTVEQMARGHWLRLRIETSRGFVPSQVNLSGFGAALESYLAHRPAEPGRDGR